MKSSLKIQYVILVSAIIFQTTALKFIWGLENVSRYVNIGFAILLQIPILFGLSEGRRALIPYLMYGCLVVFPSFLNITYNVAIKPGVVGNYGMLLPWFCYLSIPYMLKRGLISADNLWKNFNKLMFGFVIVGIIEHIAIQLGLKGVRVISAGGGNFAVGLSVIAYVPDDSDIHYRFYSIFSEPGSLAMYLISVIAYSFLHRMYIKVVVYSIAFFMADSLGGYISLLILVVAIIFVKFRKYFKLAFFCSLIVAVVLGVSSYNRLTLEYERKGESARVRENAFLNAIQRIPEMIYKHPLGMEIFESTEEAELSGEYLGSNFVLGNIFRYGGVLAMIGYIGVLWMSFVYSSNVMIGGLNNVNEQVVAISLICFLPYIFQRAVVWDSSLFALMFAPYIISQILRRTISKTGWQDKKQRDKNRVQKKSSKYNAI
jgi:hypothetical protein